MKVKDLIKSTVWSPGFAYAQDNKPKISVLLPTYRRAANNFFRRAVEAILNQTLRDIELIIVDDASTDGTADQIAEFMRRDGRVSCLRHPNNIGLPAVSEYEAFLRARADYIAFAFDDDHFYPDALEKLLEEGLEHPNNVCFGRVLVHSKDLSTGAEFSYEFGGSFDRHNIRSWNFIPNTAVLLPRRIIEDVGFYDPHILLARVCDWDLWRRISERHFLRHVDVLVGEVSGPATDNSLGATYVLAPTAAEEWCRSEFRRLKLSDYPEVNVFDVDTRLSTRTQQIIADLVEGHIATRPWLGASDELEKNKTVFVLNSHHNASVSLCFDYLPPSISGKIRIVNEMFPISDLVEASCLIVVRLIDPYHQWIASAAKIGVPVYYFIDDNFAELANEGVELTEDFSVTALQRKLRPFSGVLVSTPALLDYFMFHRIHRNIKLFPVSYARPLPEVDMISYDAPYDLTIASLAGAHRSEGLHSVVLPAITGLARDGFRIHLVITGGRVDERLDAAAKELSAQLSVTLLPVQTDIRQAQIAVAEHRPDVLVHSPSVSVNNSYKTTNIILSASLLNAVLIAPNDPPFRDAELEGAAVLVDPSNDSAAWKDALKRLVVDEDARSSYKRKAAIYCRTRFSGDDNERVLRAMLKEAPFVNNSIAVRRLAILDSKVSKPMGGYSIISAGVPLALRVGLDELARLRALKRRLRSFLPGLKRKDIWPNVSAPFADVQDYLLVNKIKRAGTYLELSDSIHSGSVSQFTVNLRRGALRSAKFALGSDGVHDGTICIELIDSNGNLIRRTERDLTSINLDLPVVFDFGILTIDDDGDFRVCLETTSTYPIYVYEIARYTMAGLIRKVVAPFARFEYVDDTK